LEPTSGTREWPIVATVAIAVASALLVVGVTYFAEAIRYDLFPGASFHSDGDADRPGARSPEAAVAAHLGVPQSKVAIKAGSRAGEFVAVVSGPFGIPLATARVVEWPGGGYFTEYVQAGPTN
jgi:hypothetical protein